MKNKYIIIFLSNTGYDTNINLIKKINEESKQAESS